jgi:hypothetical protein
VNATGDMAARYPRAIKRCLRRLQHAPASGDSRLRNERQRSGAPASMIAPLGTKEAPLSKNMTDFGIFYPRGHIVVAFGKREDAEKVRRELMTGGYDPADCLLSTARDVAKRARRNLDDHTGFLARLGKSDEAVRQRLEAAKRGSTFLLIYAPGDLEAERAMNVVRRVPSTSPTATIASPSRS